nr:protein LONGIFOLIA 1-like [Ipomoea batatas]
MSARIASSFTDDHPNLHKQIGCMNGIFHLFERHHFRRAGSHNNKRLLTGSNHNKEDAAQLKLESKDSSKILPLSQSPSTLSSLDRNKAAQLESPSSTQSNFPETPKAISKKQHDLRGVVKDSMYREARGVSIKTVAKEEGRVHVVKHIDSPRLLQPTIPGKRSDGSTRGLAKLQEVPMYSKEQDDSIVQRAKDPPRFSYDGRESREKLKTAMKLKELPRLSLDSKVRSIQASAAESRSNFLLGDTTQEFGNHKRSSSVVARLMGLEGFPYSTAINEGEVIKDRVFPAEDSVSRMKNRVTCSPQVSRKDSSSPRLEPAYSIIKPGSGSRIPLELAPWQQPDSGRALQKTLQKSKEASTSPLRVPSVYGEIEKRITELEFKKSGKDLRALKQILEAMHKRKTRLESENQEQALQTNRYSADDVSYDQSPRLSVQQQIRHCAAKKEPSSPRRPAESSIQIMKSAKLNDKIRRASSPICNREDSVAMAPRRNHVNDPNRHLLPEDRKANGRSSKAVHGSRASEQIRGGHSHTAERSLGTVSPRLQEKRHGMEKQSHLPPSEPSRVRRNQNKQAKELGLPNRRYKHKSGNRQQGGDDKSEVSSDTRNFSEQGDTASVLSENDISMVSFLDTEITSKYQYTEIGGRQRRNCKEMDPSVRLSEDSPKAELQIATIEQPSPVSVLDAKFYIEDSPSPVKKISTAFRDYDAADDNEVEWHTQDLDHLPVSTRQNLGSEFNHKKFETIEPPVHKLSLLNSTPHEDTVNQIEFFCQSDNPDHQYVNKILLASGLLRDVDHASTATCLHPTGHLLNPMLFDVLEQTEESTRLANEGSTKEIFQLKFDQRTHRKIVFDTVNEIIVHKLSTEGLLMRGRRCLSGHQFLKEVHTQMKYLQPKSDSSLDSEEDELDSILNVDMKHELEDWVESRCKIPALVLDIERLIFKDLITEVISDEAAGLQDRSRGHCRQLFAK